MGSALAITARAWISSPVSSTTPVTCPSRARMRVTVAPVRISAPASRAASAMAAVNAPVPPFTITLLPPGAGSTAALSRSTAPVPADHGPCAVPKIPRAAMAAISRSVLNHSATRSATAIGIQRSSRKPSVRPSARNRRPIFRSSHNSPAAGWLSDGGVTSSTPCNMPPSRSRVAQNSAYRAASVSDHARIASAVRATSDENGNARPSRESAIKRGSGRTNSTRRDNCMSRTTASRSGPVACASELRYPGAITSVTAAPPTTSRRSSTSGRIPAFAR